MDIPEEVATFLREIADVRDEQLSINPLSPEESARLTQQWRETTLAGVMGLVILDDANNFDHDPEKSRSAAQGRQRRVASVRGRRRRAAWSIRLSNDRLHRHQIQFRMGSRWESQLPRSAVKILLHSKPELVRR